MKNSEYKELIEKYLDGELDYQEKLNFEKELEINADLKSEFEFYELANIAVIENKLFSMQENIQFVREEYMANEKKKQFYKVLIPVVLGVLGLAMYAYWGLNRNESKVENTKSVKEIDSVIQTRKNITTESQTTNSNKVDVVPNDKLIIHNNTKVLPLSTIEDDVNVVQNIPNKVIVDTAKQKYYKLNDKVIASTQEHIKPCGSVEITFGMKEKQTCFDKHSGEIIVNKCEGGIKPYTYILSNGEQNSTGIFNQLEAGEYTMYVKDNIGCESEVKTAKIKSLHCNLDLYLDPSSSTPVRFQSYHIAGALSIYDKGGNVKFKTSLPANSEFDWYGDSESVKLAAGYYLFVIKYEDGTEQNGSITILP